MRFSHLPSEYKNDMVTEVAKELFGIRQKTVIPILKKYLSESMNEGVPLVRPLWMLDTHDAACVNVYDEFSVGEELIVAPILQKGQTVREGDCNDSMSVVQNLMFYFLQSIFLKVFGKMV